MKETNQIYGEDKMDYVVHCVLHLPYYVEQFGPLWVTSNFMFEGLLKTFKENVHGTTEHLKQLSRVLKTLKYTSAIEDSLEICHDQVASLFGNLKSALGLKYKRSKTLEIPVPKDLIEEMINNELITKGTAVRGFENLHLPQTTVSTPNRSNGKQIKTDSSWIAYCSEDRLLYARVDKIIFIPSTKQTWIRANLVSLSPLTKPDGSILHFFFEAKEYPLKKIWLHSSLIDCTLLSIRHCKKVNISHNVKYF